MTGVGIIGGAGFTAGELIRILINHRGVKLDYVISTSQTGKVSNIHRDLIGDTDLEFSNLSSYRETDIVFLCQGHGKSRDFLEKNGIYKNTRYIDLSQDFRHKQSASFNGDTFIYGLSEVNTEAISNAHFIANPGCFATSIELALYPLFQSGHNSSVHVNAITGSTGAGQALLNTTSFNWRNNNVSIYKPFSHQHEKEIKETLGIENQLFFLPVRGNFTRGIFCTAYSQSKLSLEQLANLYHDFYNGSAFVKISDGPVDLKQVVNTNKCLIHIEKHEETLLITCVIDNLLKGASGQAVQNMNIMLGQEESTGLLLKSNYF